jgi:hypothetical protein
MRLNGSISNPVPIYVLMVVVTVGAYWLNAKAPRPPIARYRKDGGIPWVALWNMFDKTRFTPEAIAYHRWILKRTPLFLLAFLLGLFLLDLIW